MCHLQVQRVIFFTKIEAPQFYIIPYKPRFMVNKLGENFRRMETYLSANSSWMIALTS